MEMNHKRSDVDGQASSCLSRKHINEKSVDGGAKWRYVSLGLITYQLKFEDSLYKYVLITGFVKCL